MAERRALVISGGQIRELPVGDTLSGVGGVSTWREPIVVAGHNTDAVYDNNTHLVPMFLTTTEGDIILGEQS